MSELNPAPADGVAVEGPVLRALLDDVLPSGSRVLVLGPHGSDVLDLVSARAASVTTVASLPDPAGTDDLRYDLLLAAGGLDLPTSEVVPGAAGQGGSGWAERLERLAHLAAPGAVVILSLPNEFVLSGLLDSRGSAWPNAGAAALVEDESRPASAADLAAELDRVGLPASRVFAVASSGSEPRALIDSAVASSTRPGRFAARVAVQALEAASADTELLAPLADAADAAAQAGLLSSTLSGWLAVSGPTGGRSLYARIPGHDTVLAADRSRTADDAWDIRVTPGNAEHDPSVPVKFSPAAIPAVIPDAASVEHTLIRFAAAEDVPSFRALAAALGDWARAQFAATKPVPECVPVWTWDELIADADGFALGVAPWRTAKSDSMESLLAAAWLRFHDRLLGGHRHHPWPAWTVGDDLVSTWLDMSGVEASPELLARGRELADAIDGLPSTDPDLRTALLEADEARQEASELAAHIGGLEQALAYRDRQLLVRETRIRRLRAELQEAVVERDKISAEKARLHTSRTYQLANQLRRATLLARPGKLASRVRKRTR
ncbi:hypothetical protein [Kribbella deserti]|uniref:Class I SAM-dependent methyltransferase n=1 Tax=Kribbella deserti TaxID=1926257 RepID=A0ABV6QSQ2_9ACTN